MIILLNAPQLPENLGAVARVMMNFGLFELRLIAPKTDPLDPKAIATSIGAEAILTSAQTYTTIAEASADLHTLLGTCGDDDRQGIRTYHTPENALKKSTGPKVGVLFGCERTGLSQDDLSHCNATIRIPVNPHFSSMNLSHAVAIVAYEWFKATSNPPQHITHFGKTIPATQAQKEALFNNIVEKLDTVDYWRVPSKKPLMQQNLANLFFRMDLTEQEIRTLFGVFEALYKPRLIGSSPLKP